RAGVVGAVLDKHDLASTDVGFRRRRGFVAAGGQAEAEATRASHAPQWVRPWGPVFEVGRDPRGLAAGGGRIRRTRGRARGRVRGPGGLAAAGAAGSDDPESGAAASADSAAAAEPAAAE